MTVTAHHDLDPRPIAPDTGDNVPQNLRDLLARGPLPRSQQRQYGFAGGRLEDVHRLEAVAARMTIEEDEFLLAMRWIVRVVDVKHDAAGHAREAVAEQIDHPEPHACKNSPGRRVFKTRQCRLGHEVF